MSPLSGYNFTLHRAALTALPQGALWWQAQALLCVSDLHLGKSQRHARRGGAPLPPYEVEETLTRLEELILPKPMHRPRSRGITTPRPGCAGSFARPFCWMNTASSCPPLAPIPGGCAAVTHPWLT